jgi:putative ABC transport system permease protein
LAVVVPLLAGAGLLLSSFVRLQSVDPGFDAERLLSMRVSLSPPAYADAPARLQFWDEAVERIGAIPGVEAVAVAGARPAEGSAFTNNFNLEDRPTPPGQAEPSVPWVISEPGYFDVMGIPLLEGRGFQRGDLQGNPPVVLVDEAWARRFFPGESPVGRRFVSGGDTSSPMTEVVGVVGEVPYQGLGDEGGGAVYSPEARTLLSPFLMIRVVGDPAPVTSLVRQEMRRMDPTAPITAVATGETLLGDALTQPRHLSLLLTVFALVAMLLAVVGLYGITAYAVQRRAGDIAVRLALGGSPSAVLRMVLRQGMGLAAVGVAVGLALALAVNRTLAGLLYEVTPDDPWTLAGVVALLLSVSAMACLVPGRRAVRVDPASTLREE